MYTYKATFYLVVVSWILQVYMYTYAYTHVCTHMHMYVIGCYMLQNLPTSKV